jgi:putative transposase
MPRSGRILPGGLVYHVLNRGVARLPLFEKLADYAAFERVIGEALDRLPMRIVTYTLMKNRPQFSLRSSFVLTALVAVGWLILSLAMARLHE